MSTYYSYESKEKNGKAIFTLKRKTIYHLWLQKRHRSEGEMRGCSGHGPCLQECPAQVPKDWNASWHLYGTGRHSAVLGDYRTTGVALGATEPIFIEHLPRASALSTLSHFGLTAALGWTQLPSCTLRKSRLAKARRCPRA